jgi:hypothetical protein
LPAPAACATRPRTRHRRTSLFSADRHATLVPINITDDTATGDVIDAVQRADVDSDFAVAITGNRTRDRHARHHLSFTHIFTGISWPTRW